ncbi:MAG: PorP/SprF family type IX secretion system membrane protein [Bacteroidales bacterium]|nr:PorP/SprF family type IX secretion system membrane protein [Bacteroidales bacterium]
MLVTVYKQIKLYSLAIMLLLVGVANGQDIHFSQFFVMPMALNPAETALYDGNVRIACAYRDQWRAVDTKPYETISVGLEKQFHMYDHTFGFGLQAMRDESGYIGLEQNKLLASGAFALHVNGHVLSAGAQLGLVYKTAGLSDHTFDEQFDFGGNNVFNKDFASGEDADAALFHAAVHVGVAWEKQLSYNYIAHVGVSMFNVNTPKESLYGMELENTEQGMRYVVQLGGTYGLKGKLSVEPKILYMRQTKATDFVVGALLQQAVSDDLGLYVGTLFRYGFSSNYDASIWTIGAKYKRIKLGLSYDVNVSQLRQATNYRGAFEVTMAYLSPSWKSKKIAIPCERI